MIVDAIESDRRTIEDMATRSAVFVADELDALDAVWEEFDLLGPEDSGYEFLVDREDGRIFGFVCYGPRDLTEGVYDLYYLVVDPEARGQGIGPRLLRAAEAEAREAGARMAVAELPHRPVWETGRRFLVGAGYQVEAAVKDFYAVGTDLEIFVKRF